MLAITFSWPAAEFCIFSASDASNIMGFERKDGAQAQFNIRTDRWEVAAEAMDLVQKNVEAKRDAKAQKKESEKEAKVVKLKPKNDSGAESTNGTSDA